MHVLLRVLQYPNSAVLSSSFSFSLEQNSTGSITETCCWRRSCYQRSAALLETCLSSSKIMRQHIVLVTESSFCAVKHPSSSVLTCGQSTVLTSTVDYRIWGMLQQRVYRVPIRKKGRVAEASCCDMGWVSAERGEKHWKRASVQKVVTLNTCCCLHDIPVFTHHNRFFSDPPMFGGTQHYIKSDEKVLHFTRQCGDIFHCGG